MAQRKIILEMTPRESEALSRFVGMVCNAAGTETSAGNVAAAMEREYGMLNDLANINAALNGDRR